MPVNAGSSSPCFFDALATVMVAAFFAIDQLTVRLVVAVGAAVSVAQTVFAGSASVTVAT